MRAVILDIDGTLLDSVELHAQAWVKALAHFDIEADVETVRRQIGKGGDKLMPVFVPEARLSREGEDIEAYRSKLFKREYLDRVRPFPGVRALLERMRASGLQVALASSGKADEVAHYQDVLGIADLVDVATSADDADRSKPNPDIFEAALDKLETSDKSEIVAIGDTPYDAEAAGGAGLATIGMLGGGFSESELRTAGCVAVYRDPQDLLDQFHRSILSGRD